MEEIAAASIYASCRYCRNPRTLNEIAMETGLSKRQIARTYRLMSRIISIDLSISPIDYVPRFVSELELFQ